MDSLRILLLGSPRICENQIGFEELKLIFEKLRIQIKSLAGDPALASPSGSHPLDSLRILLMGVHRIWENQIGFEKLKLRFEKLKSQIKSPAGDLREVKSDLREVKLRKVKSN